MTELDFTRFKGESVARYANDQVTAGRWSTEGAVERASAEFEQLLPLGLSTPLHHVFQIVEPASQALVGSVWFGLSERSGSREAFVYEIQVNEAFRRQGYARQALEALEAFAVKLGARSIGLHVFSYNASAQALYESRGFSVTSLNMHKVLARASA